MQMYLFRRPNFRAVNGGDDASIVYHEYTHGLSNRLVTDAAGVGRAELARRRARWARAGATGTRKDFIVGQFPALDTRRVGRGRHGRLHRPRPHSIRTQALDCPVAGAVAALPGTLAGAGRLHLRRLRQGSTARPEVHGDGEIWAQTLWDLRDRDRLDERARALITQGMRLSPPEPSFLDMRNAILQADPAEGGAPRTQIWTVFARRGMGFFATTDDADDVTPIEDFSMPPAGGPRGRIAGRRDRRAHRCAGGGCEGGHRRAGQRAGRARRHGRRRRRVCDRERAGAHLPERLVPRAGLRPADRTGRPSPRARRPRATSALWRNWASSAGGAIGARRLAVRGAGLRAGGRRRPARGDRLVDARQRRRKSMVITLPRAGRRRPVRDRSGRGVRQRRQRRDQDLPRRDVDELGDRSVDAAAAGTLDDAGRHRMNEFAPTAGAAGVRFVRVSLRENFGRLVPRHDRVRDLRAPAPAPPAPTPTPRPRHRWRSGDAPAAGRPAARAPDVLAAAAPASGPCASRSRARRTVASRRSSSCRRPSRSGSGSAARGRWAR